MLTALRLSKPLQQSSLSSFPLSKANLITPTPPLCVLRFVQAASGGPGEMDSKKQKEPQSKKQSEPQSKTIDSMSSLGEGYATRCDEEGFGGIYAVSKHGEEKNVQEDASEFDHDQGSPGKEEEKAGHQN